MDTTGCYFGGADVEGSWGGLMEVGKWVMAELGQFYGGCNRGVRGMGEGVQYVINSFCTRRV